MSTHDDHLREMTGQAPIHGEPVHTHGDNGTFSLKDFIECPGCQWQADQAARYYAEHPDERPEWLVKAMALIELGPEGLPVETGLVPVADQEAARRDHRALQQSIAGRLEANERARQMPGVIG